MATLWIAATQADAASPDRTFLEYLAGMVEEEGEWVDPLAMSDPEEGHERIPVSRRPVDGVDEQKSQRTDPDDVEISLDQRETVVQDERAATGDQVVEQ